MCVHKSTVLTAEQRRQLAIKRKLFGCGSQCAICLQLTGYNVSHSARRRPPRPRRPRCKEDYKFLFEAARSAGYSYQTNQSAALGKANKTKKKPTRFVAYHDLKRNVAATKRMQAHKRKLLRKQMKMKKKSK